MENMENMELLERIRYFEEIFDQGLEAVENLRQALEAYEQAAPKLRELEAYYGSGLWQKDYQADEQGLVPQDLKRGVLSEDGAYNLFIENDAVSAKLKAACLEQDLSGKRK